jgi:deoxyribonuclease (pyrimidine dimer)
MTRINLVPVKDLADQHLFAEWREIKMVPAALRRSLRTKPLQTILKNIPKKYTLNTGHVTFFYNKMKFLTGRYADLSDELLTRSYNLSKIGTFDQFMDDIPIIFNTDDWSPDQQEISVNVERIVTRINQKPEWYKYNGKKLTQDFYGKYK